MFTPGRVNPLQGEGCNIDGIMRIFEVNLKSKSQGMAYSTSQQLIVTCVSYVCEFMQDLSCSSGLTKPAAETEICNITK
jgi:hypothetical protein